KPWQRWSGAFFRGSRRWRAAKPAETQKRRVRLRCLLAVFLLPEAASMCSCELHVSGSVDGLPELSETQLFQRLVQEARLEPGVHVEGLLDQAVLLRVEHLVLVLVVDVAIEQRARQHLERLTFTVFLERREGVAGLGPQLIDRSRVRLVVRLPLGGRDQRLDHALGDLRILLDEALRAD